jgi:hypothetical protein
MTAQQREALGLVVDATLDAVKAAGPTGCPGGPLYAALMQHGCSYSQFTSLMSGLERAGKVRRDGDRYFIHEGADKAA